MNLSNGVLTIGYRSGTSLTRATICFKPTGGSGTSPGIPNEVFTRFPFTGTEQAEIRVPLPGAPGLWEIKEIVITAEPKGTVDLSITRLAFTPNDVPRPARNARQGTRYVAVIPASRQRLLMISAEATG